MLYVYEGGNLNDYEQSHVLGSMEVNCRSWEWVTVAYASARLAGLASNNSLGSFCLDLMIFEEDGSDVTTPSATQSLHDSHKVCADTWERLCRLCETLRHDHIPPVPYQ